MDYSNYVPILKALADETRLKIVDMLSCGECCACELLEQLHITQPTLSHHMRTLTVCGLVDARKEGKWMRYQLNKETISNYKSFIEQLLADTEDCICKACKEE